LCFKAVFSRRSKELGVGNDEDAPVWVTGEPIVQQDTPVDKSLVLGRD